MKKQTILLFLILLLATVLRLWHIGTIPPSPDWDEVALGYDAYSIMHTGRDEFGTFMPAVLRSFDDYKPAFYAYLAIPSVAVFGLTTFAVRLPSVVTGLVGVLVMYFLVKEMFENREKKYTEVLALLSAFLLAICPWQIQFSRTGFETNVGLTINLLVALFFLKGLKKPWMLSLAAFFAGLNLSVYQSERVFTPLFFIALVFIYRKELFAKSRIYIISGILVGIIAVLPTLLFIISIPVSLQRVQGTSLFSQQTGLLKTTIIRNKDDKDSHDFIGQLIDNRRVIFAKEIVAGYLSHFDPNWLFIEGDNARHHAPRMGLLYIIDLPFLLFGFYTLFFGKFGKKTKYLVFSWLLLAPVPAAITFEVPHAVRTMNMLPILLLVTAIGYLGVFQFLKSFSKKYNIFILGIYALFILLAVFNFIYYLNQYFVQQNYFNAVDWQYGYAQAIPQIEKLKGNYDNIIVSDTTPMDKSYMFFLFYMQYPPQQYQQLVAQGQNLVSNDHHFDTYEFRPFNWNTENVKKRVLYVGTVNDFPSTIVAKEKIYYPDGTPAILMVDPKDNL